MFVWFDTWFIYSKIIPHNVLSNTRAMPHWWPSTKLRTVHLGASKYIFFWLNLTKLEVRSMQRAHSGLSGTGRIASWKWKLEKLGAAASKLGQAGRAPSGGCLALSGVPIGTVGRVLPYITPTWGPPTFCMGWTGTGRSVAFHKNWEVVLQKRAT